MTEFKGFPAWAESTPVPNVFFSSVLPRIDDIAELKVTLHVFRAVYGKKGHLRFVTRNELLNERSLIAGLDAGDCPVADVLGKALEKAERRGTILHLVVTVDGKPEDVYFLNSATDRKIAERIKNGELAPGGIAASGQSRPETGKLPPDIFTLYEQNVGMLTPLIAEQLTEAEKNYPEDWIRDAFREAAVLNKRSWRYIERILERWSVEGKGDGTNRGDIKTGPGKRSGPEQGQIFQR